MMYDPSTSYDVIQEQVPAVAFVDYWGGLFPFNDTFKAKIHEMSKTCGYDKYMEEYLTFPPLGPFPVDLPGTDENGTTTEECDVFSSIFYEILVLNPCFDIYQVNYFYEGLRKSSLLQRQMIWTWCN